MPKEVIYGEQLPHLSNADGSEERLPLVPVVEVAWNREGIVQVVSKTQDPYGGRYEAGTNPSVYDGYHVDLDRNSINVLIRHLRRARDQAFGRDE